MHRLIVYRNILEDRRADLLMRLIDDENPADYSKHYYSLCSETVNNNGISMLEQVMSLVLSDENVFSLSSERGKAITGNLKKAVFNDIKILKNLCSSDFTQLAQKAKDGMFLLMSEGTSPLVDLFKYKDPEFLFGYLYDHYSSRGCGIFRNNFAFTVDENLRMQPVKDFAPLEINELFGYDGQKKDLIYNTRRFTENLPAHNVLLFGDSGTGKSTMVKAMLPMFSEKRLRLIEVEKDKLHSLPELMTALSKRGLYFIIFIDDLSFEHDDEEYKFLKSVIQGGLYEIAKNVRFYVTSNRRNIVKQDMRARANEVNINDYLNETISLTDRFGMKIYFDKPVKKEYIEMVRFIAGRSGIGFNEETADSAVKYAFFNGGFNGRSARQFIDSLITG